jgi:hypothetical protein
MNFASAALRPWSLPLQRTEHTFKKEINISNISYLAFTKLNKRLHLTVHVLFRPCWDRQPGRQWAHPAN